MEQQGSAESRWQDDLYDLLREGGVTLFSYVPDAGHKVAIERALADPGAIAVPLTTEQEGVALAAGAHLGGARSVLLMQSSGTGNCTNMLSLIANGLFPFLAVITMRGDFGEANPWQYAMGQAVQPTLEAMGVICLRAETPADVAPATTAALSMAFTAERPVAILLSQRLIGAKAF
ncbi:phosphonopyruvate decarboxylase [Bradyrhizobium sp. NP1]|uniref:phosphonopyruvate decarboxylase n=1 Tax=Bradyrhizobium sp. NP1 TaxID=3049772 RepID=UPI0025A5F98B|nr:phosphonopyruvate decarboxylase [Bradyrhizobium sp. NP1]WJR79142.1 phosphonopyruvate decarboxylase [Bradyrhizobium sp. NP1]